MLRYKQASCILFVLIILSLSLASCGSNEQSAGTGDLSFSLSWQFPPAPVLKGGDTVPNASTGDACTDYLITTVNAIVRNSSGTQVGSGNWSCSAHTGTITNIPEGGTYSIVIEGISGGAANWRGQKTGISITANQNTSAGSIVMTYVGTDYVAPVVQSVSPANNSTGISVAPSITATFTEDMLSVFIDSTTFTLKQGSTPVAGTVSYNSTTKTATFTPSANLLYSTTYTAMITTGVKDMATNSMSTDYVWSFTTMADTGDTIAPANTTLSNFISSGAASTSSATVSLGIAATDAVGVVGYFVAENTTGTTPAKPAAAAAGWNATTSTTGYNGSVNYTFTGSYVGTTTVYLYVWFKDAAGNVSSPAVSDSISYIATDNVAPVNTTVSDFINGGAASTSSASVSLAIAATDNVGVTGYFLSDYGTSTVPPNPPAGIGGWTSVTSTTSYNGTVSYTLAGTYTTTTTIYVYVWFKDAAGNVSPAVSDTITFVPPSPRVVPDTGQTISYTATTGEDSDYSTNPPSYTDNGDGTITDNVTGLVWQTQDDGVARAWAASDTYCTDNTAGLPGAGWRLPSRRELNSIVNFGKYGNAIGNNFPNTQANYYWTATTAANNTSLAWRVNFYAGGLDSIDKTTNGYYTRCVHGPVSSQYFTDNGNGTISDNVTGLMWQKQGTTSQNYAWEQAITYCEGLSLAVYTDWRLPNANELESIVDEGAYNPSINSTYFPSTVADAYWTSTTYALDTTKAWLLSFYSGNVDVYLKTNATFNVRCVRGGPGSIQIGW